MTILINDQAGAGGRGRRAGGDIIRDCTAGGNRMSTKIAWTNESWNPITGCTKISPGCKNCYAEYMARRLAGRHGYPKAPHHFDVTLHSNRLEQPLRWRKPRMIFVCSMSDLFHEDVPFRFIDRVFHTVELGRQHTFQILTKRPKRMLEYMASRSADFPLPNAWFGVSVENPDYLWRIEELLKIPAAVRFVSLEPMLKPIQIFSWMIKSAMCTCRRSLHKTGMPMFEPEYEKHRYCAECGKLYKQITGLNWVICGAESGPHRRPFDPAWALDIYKQCQAAGVPFFGKQDSGLHSGVPLFLNGREVKEWPQIC